MALNLSYIVSENEKDKFNSKIISEMSTENLGHEIYCNTNFFTVFGKRVFDLALTICGIVLFSLLFILIMFWIKLDSPGPVLFRQVRVGKNEKEFYIYKFRTMVKGQSIPDKLFTAEDDYRITKCGKILRKYKLDELPQLFNVLKGEMSLVGPRPMIPGHIAQYPPLIRKSILSALPGITDFASIMYINESEVLSSVRDPERFYKEQILPAKLSYNMFYIKQRNLWLDFRIIILTFLTLFHLVNGRMPIITCHKQSKLKFYFKKKLII